MKRIIALLVVLIAAPSAAETVIIDPSAFAAGSDVSTAYKGVTLSTAQGTSQVIFLEVIEPLHLISDLTTPVYTTGTRFSHAAGDIWSANSQCCGSQELVLRVDFKGAVTSVAVLFDADDTDTAVLQVYDRRDQLLAETYQRFSGPNTMSLEAPPKTKIAYALATFADTGRIGAIAYSKPGRN
jgi:hypothetical protein